MNRTTSSRSVANGDFEQIAQELAGERFQEWRRERQFRENIENGNPEYNRGGYASEPSIHQPHTFLQCPRKIWYRERNAPQETTPPSGHFTIGTFLEEEVASPWLRQVAEDHDLYFANDLWIESEVESPHGTLTIQGKTDPVLCDEEGVPLIPTEWKSKMSLSNLGEPATRHKAQLMAYQYGIGENYDIAPPTGFLQYIGRKKLNVQTFKIEFDPEFFHETVVPWMAEMTQYRSEERLPPQDPEQHWECDICEFRARCGKSDDPWQDVDTEGFLPLVKYPRESVHEYMASHPNAELTPTIAFHHSELAKEYPVGDWWCVRCDGEFVWDAVEWDGDTDSPPACPECAKSNEYIELSGADPQA